MATKENKKEKAGYLIFTPIEELLDDGIQFEGEAEKDRLLNQTDFIRTRSLIQRFAQAITKDDEDTLIRYLKLCIKPETLAN